MVTADAKSDLAGAIARVGDSSHLSAVDRGSDRSAAEGEAPAAPHADATRSHEPVRQRREIAPPTALAKRPGAAYSHLELVAVQCCRRVRALTPHATHQ